MASDEPQKPTEGDDAGGRWVDRLGAAAVEAEFRTGRREETVEEAERSVVLRLLRAIAGFFIIGIGIAALPLPGPGWLLIIIGLSLLPFAWAERTILLIRRKISFLYGDDISRWVASLWGDPDKIFG